jgi:hypothetical protein
MGIQQNEVEDAMTSVLTRLQEAYLMKVNSMVQAGQELQAMELAKAYTEEALLIIAANGRQSPH